MQTRPIRLARIYPLRNTTQVGVKVVKDFRHTYDGGTDFLQH